eukprot:NODE_6934_length_1624_cov_4.641951.p1 GENE.NODE_6934_length_1624_cov_4.641951~~NODE_6934_length_1624_cov_4.641951.p1  ORF type:complete len:394 (+),score=94.24 NODE_6934_length_1624_cov_4.641951:117-1298(+)
MAVMTRSLYLVWFCFFCDYVLMTMVIPIFPTLGASDTATGVLFAAKAAVQVCSSPFVVRFVDSHGKAMILAGLAVDAASNVLFTVKASYWLWFSARAVSGIASALIMSAGPAHMRNRYTDEKEYNTAMGYVTTGIVGGVCFGPAVGGVLFDVYWTLPFWALTAFDLAVMAVVWWLLPPLRPSDSSANAGSSNAGKVSSGTMLRDPEVFIPLGALVIANASISCVESTIGRFTSQVFGFSPSASGLFFLLVAVPSCTFSALAGRLGNSFGQKPVMFAALFIQGSFHILPPKTLLPMDVVSCLGLGTGMGLTDGTAPALLGEVTQRKYAGTGRVFVFSNVSVQVGFILGPVIGNILYESLGYQGCCTILGSCLVLYAPAFWRSGQPRKSEPLLGA